MGRAINNFDIITNSILWLSPVISFVVTFSLYQFLNSELNLSHIFISLLLFEKMQEPIKSITKIYSQLVDALVCLSRIEVCKYHKSNYFIK